MNCLLEANSVACFDYETEDMAYVDHRFGLLHR